MVGINKLRPPPLRINKLSHEISKPRRPPPPVMNQRLPIIIYTYSPKVIQTEPNDFMLLVQRLTGSTPTRQRCAELASTSAASEVSKETCARIPGCHELAMSHDWHSEIENEISIPFLEDSSLQGSSATESGSQRDQVSEQKPSCVSSENTESFETEPMTSFVIRERHADKYSGHELRPPPLSPYHAAEGFWAHRPPLTPSSNLYPRDLPILFSETLMESFGSFFSPCGFTSPRGACISPWVPSPGSIACKEMAFAILRDNDA